MRHRQVRITAVDCCSRADAVIHTLFAAYTAAMTLNVFHGAEQPQNCPFPSGV